MHGVLLAHAEVDCVHWLPILEPENADSVDELPLPDEFIDPDETVGEMFDLTPMAYFLAYEHLMADGTFPPECWVLKAAS